MDRGPDTQVAEIELDDVLERVKAVIRYGYGRIEVVVRGGKISTVNTTESLVRTGVFGRNGDRLASHRDHR